MDELKTGWAELLAKSSEKAARLRHAYDAHQLNRRIVEMELWMERIESQIASEDHGTDIESAEQLLDQFRALRAEIDAKKMPLCELVGSATKLGDSELCDRAEMLQSRWEAMGEPCQIRAENLVSFALSEQELEKLTHQQNRQNLEIGISKLQKIIRI